MVTGESPLLQTDSSTVSSLINEKTVQDAPIPGRNIIRMVQMIPGASEGALSSLANGTRPDERRQTSSVSINGVNDVLNNQLVDGMDNNERTIGTVGIKPSIDAIAEVRVQTNMYTAETGPHAWRRHQHHHQVGRQPVPRLGLRVRPPREVRFAPVFRDRTSRITRQNQYGGSLGGPISANKTFFFADYEGYRLKQGVPTVITVPTAEDAQRRLLRVVHADLRPDTAVAHAVRGQRDPGESLRPHRGEVYGAVAAADQRRAGQ